MNITCIFILCNVASVIQLSTLYAGSACQDNLIQPVLNQTKVTFQVFTHAHTYICVCTYYTYNRYIFSNAAQEEFQIHNGVQFVTG